MSNNIQPTGGNSISDTTDRRCCNDRGACVMEDVPEDLFPMIQIFLKSEQDYRNLMSTRVRKFHAIKFNTAKYTFKTPSEVLNCFSDQKQMLTKLTDFIRGNVKDKRRQTALNFSEGSNVRQSRQIMQELFSGCAHIYFTHLSVKSIPVSYFKNVAALTFGNCKIEKFPAGTDSLVALKFIGCTDVKDLSALADLNSLNEVLFGNCHGAIGIPVLPNLGSLSLSMQSGVYGKELFARFASLQRVSLSGSFPDNAKEAYKSMINIPEICIQNFSETVFPQLPVLHGKMMLIYGFNLSDWNKKKLPSTEWLKFRDCIGITALGDLPKAHTLTIYNCQSLKTTGEMPLL
jgi:hypothetical protein